MPTAIAMLSAMLVACRGNLGAPPAFSAMADGLLKGVGNIDKGTRIAHMKKKLVL